VDLVKNKIKFFRQKVKLAWAFFNFFKKNIISQADLDRKLVYDLSPRKIPNSGQIKHLKKFLNPREFLIVKICALIILLNGIYLGVNFVNKHLQFYPVSGGEYSEGIVGYPQTINPLYAVNRDIDSDLSRLIYSSLFVYNENGLLSNDLAEDVTISASSTEYTIKIKENVKWHNGDDLTVDDIIFTLGLIQNSEYHSPLRPALANIKTEKVDSTTIKFILTEPYSPFLELLNFGILPKNLWENISPKMAMLSDLNLRPVGSGPFKFKSLIKNSTGDLKDYYLTVNNNYYGQVSYLKTIDFKFFPSYQEAIKALSDKQIIGLSYLPFDLRGNLLAKDSLNLHELVQAKNIALFFNSNNNKTLADKSVRIALANALNKKQIIQDVFLGIYQENDGPLLEQNFAYNEAITKYNYSPESATATIKNKPLTTILTVVDTGSDVAVAEQIKTYWEKIGVNVTLRIIPGEQAVDVIRNRNFEILLYGEFVGGDPDVYAFWHSSQAGSNGLNLSNYNNSEVDKLLAEARSTSNTENRISKYKKFQEIISNELPAIFLYSPTYTYAQGSRLKGFSGTIAIEPADRFASVSSWYLNTKSKFLK